MQLYFKRDSDTGEFSGNFLQLLRTLFKRIPPGDCFWKASECPRFSDIFRKDQKETLT